MLITNDTYLHRNYSRLDRAGQQLRALDASLKGRAREAREAFQYRLLPLEQQRSRLGKQLRELREGAVRGASEVRADIDAAITDFTKVTADLGEAIEGGARRERQS